MTSIEPSEILRKGEEGGTIREERAFVTPWLRLTARFFDYGLFALLLRALRLATPAGKLPFGHYESFIPFEYLVWIPIEALLLTTWGTTPGKFFLKIKLKWGKKGKPPFSAALFRSFHVWFRGLGMGIAFITIICLLVAYHRLTLLRQTSWDRDDHFHVSCSPIAKWRIIFAALLATFALLFYIQK